jgi:uncharacterized protein YlxP (DUF503 family)
MDAQTMIVGACTIELNLPGVHSLKEKRSAIKSLTAQISKKFRVSAAEVGLHDVWQSATIGVVVVSTNRGHAEEVLDNVAAWIERHRPDVDLIDHSIETLVL